MNTVSNIQKISLIFFLIFGLTHLVTGLMSVNGSYETMFRTIRNIIDIPFILSALLYGASSLKLSIALPDKKHTMLDATLTAGVILILIAVTYINFFIPDINGAK